MNDKQKQAYLKVKKKFWKEKVAPTKALLEHPSAKVFLKMLEVELCPDSLLGKTDSETNYNLGKRDAYIFIKQLLDFELEVIDDEVQ